MRAVFLKDLRVFLRDRGLEAMATPAGVLVAYGATVPALGLALFRRRHSAR